jgi:hypothetical protein
MRTPRNIWQIHYRHTGNSDRLMETSYNIEAAMMDNQMLRGVRIEYGLSMSIGLEEVPEISFVLKMNWCG